MTNRLRILSLAITLVFVPLAPTVRAQGKPNDARKTANIRSEISKRVANRNTRVNVKLLSGEELKGRIDQVDKEGFTLTADKTDVKVKVSYNEVSGVKSRGLGTGTKFGIIAALTVGLVLTVAVLSSRKFDPFKNGVLR